MVKGEPLATAQRPETDAMTAFRKWWEENRVMCQSHGIKQEYAWMIYRAGWHKEPK